MINVYLRECLSATLLEYFAFYPLKRACQSAVYLVFLPDQSSKTEQFENRYTDEQDN